MKHHDSKVMDGLLPGHPGATPVSSGDMIQVELPGSSIAWETRPRDLRKWRCDNGAPARELPGDADRGREGGPARLRREAPPDLRSALNVAQPVESASVPNYSLGIDI